MYLVTYLTMQPNNEGLTVGELTIAIGTLIIIFLIWSGISSKQNSQKSFNQVGDYSLVMKS